MDQNKTSLLDIPAVAERLGISGFTIRMMVRERRIPHLRIGRRVLFDPRDIDAFLASSRVPAEPAAAAR